MSVGEVDCGVASPQRAAAITACDPGAGEHVERCQPMLERNVGLPERKAVEPDLRRLRVVAGEQRVGLRRSKHLPE